MPKLPPSFPRRLVAFTALAAAGVAALPHRCPAPIVIRPGEGVTFSAAGAEEVPNMRDAQAQFDAALAKENAGELATAVAGYRKTVRRFPKAPVAANAQFKIGQIYEKQKEYMGAFRAYEKLVKEYPRSADFDRALEGEFRIGTAYLEGARQKVLGVPTLPSMNTAVTIFTSIVKNAPFSRYAAASQFNIGMAKERQNELRDAIGAFQTVVDKYPTDPAAADALYQIGFVWLTISKNGSYDRVATVRARESFEDFLAAYPNHEKAAQARENLTGLGTQQTGGAFRIAKYYDRQKQYKAAIIYYNDVIRQSPNSKESEQAKQRLAALRTKFGDAAVEKILNPTAPDANAVAAANGAAGVAPPPADPRLQAQTDTAKRPDYNGPAVSAPPPAVPPSVGTPIPAGVGRPPGRPASSGLPGAAPLTLPPAIPDADQPAMPAPEAPTAAEPAPPATTQAPTSVPAAPEAATQPTPAAQPTP